MHILFIGGTRFVGRAMAEEALARGHGVDLFHRGEAQPGVLPGARHLRGDRHVDLSALAGGRWDATVDVCGYRPHELHRLADALGDRGGHQVFVSSVSVYDDGVPAGSREDAPLRSTAVLDGEDEATVPITGDTYGALRVRCEQALRQRHAQPLILRPSFVFGPHDPTNRLGSWIRRAAAGGEVHAPGPADAPMQWVDARDLATFTLDALRARLHGTFHLAGPLAPGDPAATFGSLLQAVADTVGPAGTRLRWLPPETALQRTLGEGGATAWPLWSRGERSALMTMDSAAAQAQGLRCRPLAQTVADTWDWMQREG